MNIRIAAIAIAITGLSGTANADTNTSIYPFVPTKIALDARVYTQDFRELANSGLTGTALPVGWQVSENGGNADFSYAVGTGNDGTGNVYSFGLAGSSERALGSVTSSNRPVNSLTGEAMTSVYYGALFTNALSSTIGSLTIGYTGERWRRGRVATTDKLTFQYRLGGSRINSGTWIDVPGLTFTSPSTSTDLGALIGNRTANRTVLEPVTITNLSIEPGATFAIRWVDVDVSGSDDGLAIDDVSVLAAPVSAVPEPASWALMLAGFALTGTMLRRRRTAIAFA